MQRSIKRVRDKQLVFLPSPLFLYLIMHSNVKEKKRKKEKKIKSKKINRMKCRRQIDVDFLVYLQFSVMFVVVVAVDQHP